MANVAKTHLFDKDVENLAPQDKRYFKVVGDPKELCVFVNPKGTKKFSLRIKQGNKTTWCELKEFREGIYSVAEARKEAWQKLKDLEKADGNVEILKNGNEKYSFGNLFELYIEQQRKKGLIESSLKRTTLVCQKYLLPSLAKRDVKGIRQSDLLAILNAIFNQNNPATSRLETIHRIIGYLHNIFKIAIKDRYLEFDPSYGLKDEFPSKARFNAKHGLDTRHPALTNDDDLRDFIQDLKNDNKLELQTKRAIYLQILSANRPFLALVRKFYLIKFLVCQRTFYDFLAYAKSQKFGFMLRADCAKGCAKAVRSYLALILVSLCPRFLIAFSKPSMVICRFLPPLGNTNSFTPLKSQKVP